MRWYPSKVDGWLAAVLALAPLVSIGAVVAAFASGADVGWIGILPALLLIAIYGGLVFPMRYAIDGDMLVVRHGLVRQRIPLADITEVKPTNDMLSSPALSLDRLHIAAGKKSLMISPADKQAFLAELATRAHLERDGDRLVRR